MWQKTDVLGVIDVVALRTDVGIWKVEHLIAEGFDEFGPSWKLLQIGPEIKKGKINTPNGHRGRYNKNKERFKNKSKISKFTIHNTISYQGVF